MKKLRFLNSPNMTGRQVREQRNRWEIDGPTLAGRADVGMQSLRDWENRTARGRPEVWRVAVHKALRQLIYERALETIAVLGPQIEADPDAAFYTKQAAARRRIDRYGSYSTASVLETAAAINSNPDAREADDDE